MIDPDFWTDEKLGDCTRDERLLFMGLISNADDEGRGRANAKLVKSTIFPYDEDLNSGLINTMLKELDTKNIVQLYIADQQEFYFIKNFKKHQVINKKQTSKLPLPPQEILLRENYGSSTVVVSEDYGVREEKRREDNIREEKEKRREELALEDEQKPFSKVLNYFCTKSGIPSIRLKPADTQAAEELCKLVPIEIIFLGINESFDRYKPKHSEDKIRSLNYCKPIVLDIWENEKAKKGGLTNGQYSEDNKQNGNKYGIKVNTATPDLSGIDTSEFGEL